MFSAFNPSKCTHLEQWAADCAVPGEQLWTSCRSRDSNPQPWVTSGFKSNALSIRPTTAPSRPEGAKSAGFRLKDEYTKSKSFCRNCQSINVWQTKDQRPNAIAYKHMSGNKNPSKLSNSCLSGHLAQICKTHGRNALLQSLHMRNPKDFLFSCFPFFTAVSHMFVRPLVVSALLSPSPTWPPVF